MAILQSDGVNHTSDLILRRNGTEGLRLTSSTVQVSSINDGPLAGFRNAIINGNFDFWQRGTSQTAVGYGSADRWQNAFAGSTSTMSRQAFTVGQTAVPGEPEYFVRMTVSSVAGGDNFAILLQAIEGVRTFAGQQVTISFWAKADASKNISIEFQQNFGTGGSPSSSVFNIGTTKKALTTSWQKISHTVTIPSISGKTLGSVNNSSLVALIWFDAGGSFNTRTDSLGQQSGTFDIAQVQLEAGPVATPFERRPIGTELALCQRYFTVSTHRVNSYPAQFGSITTFYGATVSLPVQMRNAPTASYLGLGGGGNHWVIAGFSAYSANTLNSLDIQTTNTSFKFNQVRTAGGATPFNGDMYLWENNFSMLLSAEL
jgi:hypothetical protein